MSKKVIAYEDEPLLRKQLEYVFYAIRDEFQLLASFPDPSQLVDNLASCKPDIVVMDIQMREEEDGLFALYQIKKINPAIRVMMLTTFDNDDKVFNAICIGADGYMLKTDFAEQQVPHEAMRKSLKMISDGGAYLTPSVAKRILNLFSDQTIADKIQRVKEGFQVVFQKESSMDIKHNALTKMQTTVLRKIVDGKTTSEIARELDLKENTVNSHIKAVYNTMEVHSRSKAIKKAMAERWVQ